jgi:basic membrane protein A
VYDWKVIYGKLLGDYISGRANMSGTYWLDISSGGVKLYPLSNLVGKDTRMLLEREQERIVKKRDVFSGVIYDNKGKLRCAEDENISDHELFTGMEWYAEGVEIYD